MKPEKARSTIRILDEITINQIAAGEVIENPSSVIKELVDNSIDADATEIEIETKGGGLQLIRVSDNGWGMNADEVLLAAQRHATSKIMRAEDLFHLHTLGFRGEALPSIASISKFSILTAMQDADTGTLLYMEGGKLIDCHPAARQKGTTVEVRNLFYNVPARKKFQRSAGSETAEINKVLNRIALCYPEIQITWIHDDKKSLSLFPTDLKGRMEALFGVDLSVKFFAVKETAHEWNLEGFISTPDLSKTHRLGQHLFINHRGLVCPFISDAVREGYSTRLSEGDHPLYVLFLSLPPSLLDINVHPQKREARFLEESKLSKWISERIAQALLKEEGSRWTTISSNTQFIEPNHVCEAPASFAPSIKKIEERQMEFKPEIKFLVSEERFALLQEGDKIVLIDPQALLQAFFFNELKENIPASQVLLFPITYRVQPEEGQIIESYFSLFEQWGFHLRLLGRDLLAIDAIPALLSESEVISFLEGIIKKGDSFRSEMLKEIKLALATKIKKTKWSGEELIALYKRVCTHPHPPLMWKGMKTCCEVTQDHLKKILAH